jgi:hypothetical protein
MLLEFERCPSSHRQQTYLFHPRYLKQRAPHGQRMISFPSAGLVAPLPVRQTALIESALL